MLRGENTSKKRKVLGALFLSLGGFFFIGLHTQLAGIVTLLLTSLGILKKNTIPEVSRSTLFLMASIALSLFITGAGPFAFDLPI
jgi:hypothetical protein